MIACISESSGTATNVVDVTLVVSDICVVVDAPDVDFGSAALPASFSSVSGTLQVRCTLESAYTVDLSSDDETSDWRVMTSSGNSDYTLQYQLYRSDSTAWSSDNDISDTGSGLAQSITYTAQINSDQDNVQAGSYTVTVTVNY